MTTSVTAAGRPAPGATAVEWLTQWVKDHKRAAAYIAAVLAIAAALFVWNLLSTRTAERSAGRQLEQGRLALASRNYQLAASVLSQVTENYAGTHAAQEGTILLAQVRLAQGQSQRAVDVLRRSLPRPAAIIGRRPTGCWAGPTRTHRVRATRPTRTSGRRTRRRIPSCAPSFSRTRAGRGWRRGTRRRQSPPTKRSRSSSIPRARPSKPKCGSES